MRRTAAELAEQAGAKLEGDGTLEIGGVAGPERAGAGDLIYVETAKYAGRAVASAALCVIATDGVSLPGKTILRSRHPRLAFAKAAALLLDRPPIASGIHATAIVAPLARVAAGVGIGPYAVIGEDAHIGAGTQIGAHCVVGAGCWIGENCRIHPRVTLYGSVRIEHRSGMNLHAMPDSHAAIEGHSRTNPAILADPASRANYAVGSNLRPGADVSVFANHGVRTNANACRDACKGSNNGGRVNSRCDWRAIEQQRGCLCKREPWVPAPQDCFAR